MTVPIYEITAQLLSFRAILHLFTNCSPDICFEGPLSYCWAKSVISKLTVFSPYGVMPGERDLILPDTHCCQNCYPCLRFTGRIFAVFKSSRWFLLMAWLSAGRNLFLKESQQNIFQEGQSNLKCENPYILLFKIYFIFSYTVNSRIRIFTKRLQTIPL